MRVSPEFAEGNANCDFHAVAGKNKTMKRALPLLLDTLHTLALALWLGALAVWAMLAQMPPAAAPTRALLAPQIAGLVEICGLLMVGAQFLLRRRYLTDKTRFVADGARQLLTFGALLLAEFGKYGQTASQLPSSAAPGMGLAFAQIALLIVVVALTSWLQAPRPINNPAGTIPAPQTGRAAANRRAAR